VAILLVQTFSIFYPRRYFYLGNLPELVDKKAMPKFVSISFALLISWALTVALVGQDSSIRPFTIHVEEAVLEDLQDRLKNARFPDQIQNSGWDYGTDKAYLTELVEYWKNEYDWRKHEKRLNKLDHFKTEIDGLDIHFIHQRSKHEDALPLVITHGWPGSVVEFLDIIGPLTDPEAHGGKAEDAFHVICPSMPGFGFSGKPTTPGYSVARIGETVAKLMVRLGYTNYGAQGGDWGSSVTTWLGENDSEHVAGIHLNFARVAAPKETGDLMAGVPEKDIQRMRMREEELKDHWAYGDIQGTRPQTLGYGLNDSPVGLAGWITDKCYIWSDNNGDIENSFTKDQLLTNIMVYWTTGTITSSTRIYYESRRSSWRRGRVEVPTAVAVFPKEIRHPIRKWVETRYNIQQWTEMPQGGHFAALEEPELLVGDLRKFFRKVR